MRIKLHFEKIYEFMTVIFRVNILLIFFLDKSPDELFPAVYADEVFSDLLISEKEPSF